MNVLITGMDGFIGQYLSEALLREGHNVVGVGKEPLDKSGYYQIDILDTIKLNDLFVNNKFDAIYHLAALTAHDDIVDNKEKTLQINLQGTNNLVYMVNEYCTDAIFFYTSTGKVYGETNELPISEKALVQPTNILGKAKFITERIIDFYGDQAKNKFVILRIFNIYGFKQKENFIIPTLINQMKKTNTLSLGNIDDMRDYLYIEDLIEVLVKLLKLNYKTTSIEYFNIGSGLPLSVRQIISNIEHISGRKYEIEIDNEKLRFDEVKTEYANISKVKEFIDWEPKFDICKGLKIILGEHELCKL